MDAECEHNWVSAASKCELEIWIDLDGADDRKRATDQKLEGSNLSEHIRVRSFAALHRLMSGHRYGSRLPVNRVVTRQSSCHRNEGRGSGRAL
jgi:hypothetical protein